MRPPITATPKDTTRWPRAQRLTLKGIPRKLLGSMPMPKAVKRKPAEPLPTPRGSQPSLPVTFPMRKATKPMQRDTEAMQADLQAPQPGCTAGPPGGMQKPLEPHHLPQATA